MSGPDETTLRDAVTRPGADHDEMLACLREHGICVVPGFLSHEFRDPIREVCKARLAEAGDRNDDAGSHRRSATYHGKAARSHVRTLHPAG